MVLVLTTLGLLNGTVFLGAFFNVFHSLFRLCDYGIWAPKFVRSYSVEAPKRTKKVRKVEKNGASLGS